MKNLFINLCLILVLCLLSMAAYAVTPTQFTFQFYDANGQPDTNYTTMQGWPPASGSVTVVSNVIVFAGANQIITNTFVGTNTLGTNSAMPNNYQVLCPATGLGFFVTIPQTTNLLPLATYATGVPVTYPSSSLYFYVTNALGFQPAPATYAGITAAIGGFVLATNGGPLSYTQLPWTPPTNTYAGLTNAAGFAFATNTYSGLISALTFAPATNNPATNTIIYLTGVTGITNASGLVTNLTTVSATNTIDFQQR